MKKFKLMFSSFRMASLLLAGAYTATAASSMASTAVPSNHVAKPSFSLSGNAIHSNLLREPSLTIVVDQAILKLSGPPTKPVSTNIRITPNHFPTGAKLSYQWRQVQDEMTPGAAIVKDKPIVFSSNDSSDITATFADSGVYEMRVTVTANDSSLGPISVSRNVWVNVWDYCSPIVVNGKGDPLAVIPGMLPPKVRNLTPDPGPFVHPRLYCTEDEWQDIHDRCVGGKSIIAAKAWNDILGFFDKGVNPKSKEAPLLNALEAFADAGFKGQAPDLTQGKKEAKDYELDLYYVTHALGESCFVQWVKNDPALPQDRLPKENQALCKKLAKQVGALSRVLLEAQWDRQTGQFKTENKGYLRGFNLIGERSMNLSGLALAYEFIYNWMTPEQQRDTRNLLIAAGRGRKGDGQRTGHANAKDRWVERGYAQNGNFPCMGENGLVVGLAVSGEESGADPAIIEAFLNPPKPKDYDKAKGPFGYDQVQLVHVDTGRDQPLSKPYPEAITWPHARKADVNNLQRQIWGWQESHISPWGFTLERMAYFGSMTDEVWPMAVVYARFGGFNQYVGCHFYQTVNNVIFTQYPSGGNNNTTLSKSFTSPMGMYEHHSGGGDYRQQHILLLKYMYPEDSMVDYAYATQAPQIENRVRNKINTCIFGLDPRVKNWNNAFESVAVAKELPLTKLDPQEGIVVLRSGWKDDDIMLYFDAGATVWGHMNAERSSFAFFALGRHWSVPTGFHKIHSNFQSLVSVQNPAWAECPTTQGFMSVNPSIVPQVKGCDYNPSFPTPPSRLVEVRESSDGLWSFAACDAKTAFNMTFGAPKGLENTMSTLPWPDYFYPGFVDYLRGVLPDCRILRPDFLKGLSSARGCGLENAQRTVMVVRGQRPYAIVVDDFRKDGQPTNWRWALSDKITMKEEGRGKDDDSFCVVMAPGSTSTQAILLHQRDQGHQAGLPRLLVRDVSELNNAEQPCLRMDKTEYKLGEAKYSLERTNRLFIERNKVAEPQYKVLLFPYRTGETLPETTWDIGKKTLTVQLNNGTVDKITFERDQNDLRTRIALKRL